MTRRLASDEASERGGSASRSVGSGTWELPAHPTIADLLAASQPATVYSGQRVVDRFRRLGIDHYGLWFDFTLFQPLADLDIEDVRFIRITWEQFVTGQRPFRKRSRG